MRILFLHLSDTHFDNKNKISDTRIEKIVSALQITKHFDECIILFSGDIANSGKSDGYAVAKSFLGFLIDKLKCTYNFTKFINVFIVPGNHDVDYGSCPRNRSAITQYYEENRQDEVIKTQEPKMLTDFFAFSALKKCFCSNPILDQRLLNFNNIKLKVNLINSAMFSVKEGDKGLHYFPNNLIDRLYISDQEAAQNTEIAITIMHHTPEWFNEDSKLRLLRVMYDGTSILFLGHEHNHQTNRTSVDHSSFLHIVNGGVLFDPKDENNSTFNALVIDSEKKTTEVYKFAWNASAQFFKHSKPIIDSILYKKSAGYKLFPLKEYIVELNKDEKHSISGSFKDYFVFPRLSTNSVDKLIENKEICDQESFLKELFAKKKIIIVGKDNYGKTTFLKNLYIELLKNKTPLFFSPDDIKKKSVPKIINEIFREQYGDNDCDWAKFQQLNSSKKVALIDNMTNIKKGVALVSFLDNLNEEFDYIVISANDELELNLMDSGKEYFASNQFAKYRLAPFYIDKRRELITNIISLSNNGDEIDDLVNETNGFIKNQLQMFKIDPDFIIQYTYYFSHNTTGTNNKNVFSSVFEHNIVSSLKKENPNSSIDAILTVLEEIAHYIHFGKRYPISRTDFEQVIKNYNDEYQQNISPSNLLTTIIAAKIVKEINNGWDYKFCNNNYLSYFLARRLSRKYNEDHSTKDLEYILDNICFGINGDVVLFLIYLQQNIQILQNISFAAELHMDQWSEFDFSKNDIAFFEKYSPTSKGSPPNASDKANLVKAEIASEKIAHDHEVIETVDLYDYDDDAAAQKISQLLKALKYAEIVAKSLPIFSHILKKHDKDNLVQCIYSFPNKIVYSWLHEVDNNFDSIADELLEYLSQESLNPRQWTKEEVGMLLSRLALMTTLKIYDYISNITTDKQTISLFNAYDISNNVNYKLQNILMESCGGTIDAFVKKSDGLYDSTKNEIVKFLLMQIVRKVLLQRDNIDRSKEQHLKDKYFSNTQNKSLLMSKGLQQIKQKNENRETH